MCGVGAVVVLGLSRALSLEDLPGNLSLRLAALVALFCAAMHGVVVVEVVCGWLWWMLVDVGVVLNCGVV